VSGVKPGPISAATTKANTGILAFGQNDGGEGEGCKPRSQERDLGHPILWTAAGLPSGTKVHANLAAYWRPFDFAQDRL
jgi:hypothetical protein